MKLLLIVLTLCFSVSFAKEGDKIPSPVVRAGVQLFSHQGRDMLAVNFSNHSHWHTYWKNPGDAGRPIQVALEGIKLTPLEWPSPRRFVEPGNIVVYGYSGDYTLFFGMDAEDYQRNQNRPLSLSLKWLVCKHICLPEKSEIVVKFENGNLSSQGATLDKLAGSTLKRRREQLPRPMDYPPQMDLSLVREGDGLALHYRVGQGAAPNFSKNLNILTPLPHDLIAFKHEKLFIGEGGRVYGKMALDWDGEYADPPVPLPEDGRFVRSLMLSFLYANPYSGETGIVEKSFEGFSSVGSIDYKALSSLSPRGFDFPGNLFGA